MKLEIMSSTEILESVPLKDWVGYRLSVPVTIKGKEVKLCFIFIEDEFSVSVVDDETQQRLGFNPTISVLNYQEAAEVLVEDAAFEEHLNTGYVPADVED